MSMHYYANFAVRVSQECIRRICPERWQELVDAIEDCGDYAGLDGIARDSQYCPKDLPERIAMALILLKGEFSTRTGCMLGLAYHNTEDGDPDDDVDGHFWVIEDGLIFSPAAKNIEKDIQIVRWVEFS